MVAISRYAMLGQVDDPESSINRMATFPPVEASDIESDNDITITFSDGDRLDALASKYLGDGRYWWAICLMNNIHLPLGNAVLPGTTLRIPTDISVIQNVIKQKQDDKD